ncbi:MAG TPA: fibronectin type III domain-containing protein [Polyangia bacterium]
MKLVRDRLDLGPQIAVWVETADRARFVDTLMVTNLTARYGIGNRPGRADLPSGPWHPYGKRLNVLPIWAYARGQLYPQVVMQDGNEGWMGFHEPISSPDPYFCRPMGRTEIDVDAISCPTAVFNSAKGKLATDRPLVPYPPRNDLVVHSERDCDDTSQRGPGCARSSEKFSRLNDLDGVSAPTPPFDKVFEGTWRPSNEVKPTDELALFVEVSREFDQNDAHHYSSYVDKMLTDSGYTQVGLPNNLGQPSVVYRIPFRLDGSTRFGAATAISGFGSAAGENGTINPPDATISTSTPGSGEGRLRVIDVPWNDAEGVTNGRVFVRLDDCAEVTPGTDECSPGPSPPVAVTDLQLMNTSPTTATLSFRHGDDGGQPVRGYEIRLLHGTVATEENFLEGVPKTIVEPAAPGTVATFSISELKPLTEYVIAVRALGRCGTHSSLVQTPFSTSRLEFQQLTGCFVATAAYGSPLAPALTPLRQARDKARAATPISAAAVDLYERASPPVANLIAGSDSGRALLRQLLAPVVKVATALSPR